jgi:DNA-binding MarR family transcriptional regulator
VDDLSDDE